MTVDELFEGQAVIYVPAYAQGDVKHPGCERGIVVSWNKTYVFVRYLRHDGEFERHAKATSVVDLWNEE